MSAELKFVDTNVLVYLFDGDSPDKQARAREPRFEGSKLGLCGEGVHARLTHGQRAPGKS